MRRIHFCIYVFLFYHFALIYHFFFFTCFLKEIYIPPPLPPPKKCRCIHARRDSRRRAGQVGTWQAGRWLGIRRARAWKGAGLKAKAWESGRKSKHLGRFLKARITQHWLCFRVCLFVCLANVGLLVCLCDRAVSLRLCFCFWKRDVRVVSMISFSFSLHHFHFHFYWHEHLIIFPIIYFISVTNRLIRFILNRKKSITCLVIARQHSVIQFVRTSRTKTPPVNVSPLRYFNLRSKRLHQPLIASSLDFSFALSKSASVSTFRIPVESADFDAISTAIIVTFVDSEVNFPTKCVLR